MIEHGPPERLRRVQEWFAAVITDPRGVDEGAERARADIEAVITPGPRLSARERIGIYRDAYRARLVECLEDDYPALAFALGGARFKALAHEYIATHPSRARTLNAYGRHMSAFCSTRSDAWAGFAADLAALEWAMVEVVHAPTPPALSMDAVRAVPVERWAEARFVQSPSVRVLRFAYPVNAYYQAFRDGESPAWPEPSPSAVAVYRRGLTLWRMDLTPVMVGLLENLFADTPLGETLALVATHADPSTGDPDAPPDTEANVMTWFRTWVEAGFFARIELGEGAL